MQKQERKLRLCMQLGVSIAFLFLIEYYEKPERHDDSADRVTGVLHVIQKVGPEKTFEHRQEPTQKKDAITED